MLKIVRHSYLTVDMGMNFRCTYMSPSMASQNHFARASHGQIFILIHYLLCPFFGNQANMAPSEQWAFHAFPWHTSCLVKSVCSDGSHFNFILMHVDL